MESWCSPAVTCKAAEADSSLSTRYFHRQTLDPGAAAEAGQGGNAVYSLQQSAHKNSWFRRLSVVREAPS